MRDLVISAVGSIVASAVWWTGSTFLGPGLMVHVWDFVATFMPLFVGAFAFVVIRSSLFLYRLQTAHEALFAPWFRDRQGDIAREIAVLRHTVISELEAIRQANNAGFDTFCAMYERRLAALEKPPAGPKT